MVRVFDPSSIAAPLVVKLTDTLIPTGDGDGGAPGPFPVTAVTYDGTSDRISKGSDLSSNSDGKQFVFSCFLNANDLTGNAALIANEGNRFLIKINANGSVEITGKISGGGTKIQGTTAAGVINTGPDWQSLWMSLDMANEPDSTVWVDNIEVTPTWDTFSDGTVIDFTRDAWAVGDTTVAGLKYDGDLAEVYFHREFVDGIVQANRELFITADNQPAADLTSRSPLIYLTEPFATFHQNAGIGGDFVQTGALTEAATSPSD